MLLSACAGEQAPDPQGSRHHLFGDMEPWRVVVPRAPVLPAGVHAKLVEIVAPGKAVEEYGDAVWVTDESIARSQWKARPDAGAPRGDADCWEYHPRRRLAFPRAELSHSNAELVPVTGDALDAPAYGYSADESRVLLVLPKGAPRDGFAVSYPSFPHEILGHLGDFALEAATVPTARELTMGDETRRCVLLPPPMAIRTALEVPAAGRLHFGVCCDALGLSVADGSMRSMGSRSDGVGFRLTVVPEHGESVVLWDAFLPPQSAKHFRDQVVELGPWSGQQVELEFAAYGAPGEDGGEGESLPHVLDDFAFLSEPVLAASDNTSAAGPNVLVVLIDTLRADALGCYGGDLARTPVLDGLAGDGVLFEHARASSSWTLPSHASLFCSLFPTQHGTVQWDRTLPPNLVTVAEVVRDAGWRTLAVTGGAVVSPDYGLARGFDRFAVSSAGVASNTRKLLDWIDASDTAFFAFLHTYEVHDPYRPHDEYRSEYVPAYSGPLPRNVDQRALDRRRIQLDGERPPAKEIEYVRALYHAEVAYTDAVLGELFAELRARGLWQNTLVVVTSDHGEEFWDHGDYVHGQTLYEEMLRVPLIAHHGGTFRGGLRVEVPVRLEDIAPTVVRFLGLPGPPQWIGVPLDQLDAPRDFLAAIESWADAPAATDTMYAVLRAGHKWIQAPPGAYRTAPTVASQLFDLGADPREQRALADERLRAEYVRALDSLLAKYPLQSVDHPEVVLSAEELERLHGLGYVK